MSINLSDTQRLDWLQLIRSENVGPRTFRTLINKFGGAGAALEALPDLLRHAVGARAIRIFPRTEAEREMALAHDHAIRFIGLGEPDYPAALRTIDSPPPLLAVQGNLRVIAAPAVAIVGSRNASAAGLAMTENLARGLGKQGFATISGLARGIDAAAHRASLKSGTIAALGGGHLRLYPAEHQTLADEIMEFGALVSEMPLEWEPRGRDFPRRNRLVSGMALGVIVVEAARRSGSLITARFASEQGREVFAVPGSPLDPRAEGTNDLLREGVTMCTHVEDVTSALAPLLEAGAQKHDLFSEDGPVSHSVPLWDESDLFAASGNALPATPSDYEMNEPRADFYDAVTALKEPEDPTGIVAGLLGPSPVEINDLVRVSQMSASLVHRALLELELEGRLERHGGARVSLILR